MQWMVVLEIALALPLLFGSALLVRTLVESAAIDRGFDSRGLLAVEMPLPASKYPDPESLLALFEQLIERVEALPG
jgi:hypothetical protein